LDALPSGRIELNRLDTPSHESQQGDDDLILCGGFAAAPRRERLFGCALRVETSRLRSLCPNRTTPATERVLIVSTPYENLKGRESGRNPRHFRPISRLSSLTDGNNPSARFGHSIDRFALQNLSRGGTRALSLRRAIRQATGSAGSTKRGASDPILRLCSPLASKKVGVAAGQDHSAQGAAP
jgi:hypothetical protein